MRALLQHVLSFVCLYYDFILSFFIQTDWYHKNGTSNEDEYVRRSDEVDTSGYLLLREHGLDEYNKGKAVNKSIELVIPEVGCGYQEV